MKPLKVLVVLLSAGLAALPLPAEIIERVVAKVNGDIITLSEFTARQIAEAQAARVTPDRIEQFLRANNARILQGAIDDLLVMQKAADLGMKLRPEYIKDVIENIKKENNIESDEAFLAQLRHEGMSIDDLKRSIERSILTRQVVSREVDAKVQISEQDVRTEYEAHRADYTTPPKVHLQEIQVRADTGATLAEELVRRARAGEDFAQLAREYSVSATRAAGGELGELAHGELAADIENAALALKPGEVSEPLPRGDTLLVLRLAARKEGYVIPYEDVKADILKRLQGSRRGDSYEAFVAGLRKKAIVDIRVREVPLQVDLPSTGSILDPPSPEHAPEIRQSAPNPDPDAEFSVTPQARPDRVAPVPAPTPTPTPPAR